LPGEVKEVISVTQLAHARRDLELVATDADLADYFGSIPHAEPLKSAARRIVDLRMLHLIKMWLECPVEETELGKADTDERRLVSPTNEMRTVRFSSRQVRSSARGTGAILETD
jgi:hypothetical protein